MGTLESASELVNRHGANVVPIQLDLVDADSIAAAARLAQDVQVVVNNGGVLTSTMALDERVIAALQFEMDVNV